MRCAGISEITSGEGHFSHVSTMSLGWLHCRDLWPCRDSVRSAVFHLVMLVHLSASPCQVRQQRAVFLYALSFSNGLHLNCLIFNFFFSWRKAIFPGLKDKPVENLVVPFRILNIRLVSLWKWLCLSTLYGHFWKEHNCGTSYRKGFHFGWFFLLKATVQSRRRSVKVGRCRHTSLGHPH